MCVMGSFSLTIDNGCYIGGPQLLGRRGFPPQLDLPSSSAQGHLLETPTLESLFFFSFSFLFPCLLLVLRVCFAVVCFVFFIGICTGSRDVKPHCLYYRFSTDQFRHYVDG